MWECLLLVFSPLILCVWMLLFLCSIKLPAVTCASDPWLERYPSVLSPLPKCPAWSLSPHNSCCLFGDGQLIKRKLFVISCTFFPPTWLSFFVFSYMQYRSLHNLFSLLLKKMICIPKARLQRCWHYALIVCECVREKVCKRDCIRQTVIHNLQLLWLV